MIVRLFVALLVLIALSYAFNRFRRQAPETRKKLGFKLTLYLVAGVVLLLVATGRVHWITAVFAGIVPFFSRLLPLLLRALPFLSQMRARAADGGRTSVIQTRFLKLQLNQNSGSLQGQVLSGPFAGKALAQLSAEQARELLDYYRTHDSESHDLLQAYLQQGSRDQSFGSDDRQGYSARGEMSRAEALEILGLSEGANEEEILAAHKKLMQRLHPDRGGSNYLAVKVNQAKSVLIK